MKNPYEVLEVSKDASEDEIKKNYRKLARQYHPDRNPGDTEADAKFKEVQEAYDILSDKNKRSEYDQFGAVRSRSSAGQSPFRQGKPFTSVFNDFFADHFNQQQTISVGEHIQVVAEVTLEQLCEDTEIDLTFDRHTICATCNGAGGTQTACPHCNGTGMRVIAGRNATVQMSCQACGASGHIKSNDCQGCQGTGYADSVTETIKFKVPAGSEHGMKFVQAGKGEPCADPNGRPGNLYIFVNVQPNDFFKRMNQNIVIEVPVSYTQLIFGDSIDVPTVDGKIVNFVLPAGSQLDSKFRLSKMGMPVFNNGGPTYDRGDQFIILRLEIPLNLDDGYKEALENVAKHEKIQLTPKRKAFIKRLGDNHGTN